ncbi:MAG: excinuclease ABC subunit UvrB [Planctomycetes bacterium]|nr:excinuclease ABC subunit UvrB [Planctomycetota bacterium]
MAEPHPFQLVGPLQPKGDQPQAIDALVRGLNAGKRAQTLLGVTGSGKTFTVASVIAAVQRPALILAPNKTLAAQLFTEFRELFPHNAVEFFISYYDYYQPEAYVASSDTYIAKDASIDDRIDRMRHAATSSLMLRKDVIIVASVSCIYGIGSPETYGAMRLELRRGAEIERDQLLRRLVQMQYMRNDVAPRRATFRARGDVVEICPAWEEGTLLRVELFGDTIESIDRVDALNGTVTEELEEAVIFPSSHYVTPKERLIPAIEAIEVELDERLAHFRASGKLLEAQRLEQRTRLDLELLTELGHCSGIENYSRHLDGRGAGEPPATLLDYFPDDFLLFVDESHIAIPQVAGMHRGDRARKTILVDHGFRLPSAADNRPLTFEEFEKRVHQMVCVSATPSAYELERSGGISAEQVIRPTGLLDPEIEVRPARGQVDDVLAAARTTIASGFRVLITCLTKRMSEDLSTFFREAGLKVKYLHSDIETLERTAIIRDLRLGTFDVLVGINLLREGLDLPEVALVAILDADKEGFLRSRGSLIQTIGRAARNALGRVILYADRETDSMRAALAETDRRRTRQRAYNLEHGITPRTIMKRIGELPESFYPDEDDAPVPANTAVFTMEALAEHLKQLRAAMYAAASEHRYEDAARMRDELRQLEAKSLG